MKRIYDIIAILIIILSLSTNLVAADEQISWSYHGFSFSNTDQEIKENLKNEMDLCLEAEINHHLDESLLLRGIGVDHLRMELMKDPLFHTYYLSINVKNVKNEILHQIESHYQQISIISRNYSWFYSQNDTGTSSSENCAIACIAMVLKWNQESYDGTVEEIRSEMGHLGGIQAFEIANYFKLHAIDNHEIHGNSLMPLLAALEKRNLAICFVDFGQSPSSADSLEKNQLAHTVVLNGYFIYQNIPYVTYFDPASPSEKEIPIYNIYNTTYEDTDRMNQFAYYHLMPAADFQDFLLNGTHILIPPMKQKPAAFN